MKGPPISIYATYNKNLTVSKFNTLLRTIPIPHKTIEKCIHRGKQTTKNIRYITLKGMKTFLWNCTVDSDYYCGPE